MIYLAIYGIVVSVVVFILVVKNTNLRTELNAVKIKNSLLHIELSMASNSNNNDDNEAIKEFLKLLDELAERQKKATEKIKENTDEREKLIGDRVNVWDLSYAVLENGEKVIYDNREEFGPLLKKWAEEEAIIIKTDQKFICKIETLGIEKTCDLLVEFPDKTRIYTPSLAVRRIDNYEK